MSRRTGKTKIMHQEFIERIKEINKLLKENKIQYSLFCHPDTKLSEELENYIKKVKIHIEKSSHLQIGTIYYIKNEDINVYFKTLTKSPILSGFDFGSKDVTVKASFLKNQDGIVKMFHSSIVPRKGDIDA